MSLHSCLIMLLFDIKKGNQKLLILICSRSTHKNLLFKRKLLVVYVMLVQSEISRYALKFKATKS